jgi:hypothetical protein
VELSSQPHFLSLTYDRRVQKSRVEINKSFPDLVESWAPGTRVSPVWTVTATGQQGLPGLPDECWILFIGPADPFLVFDAIQGEPAIASAVLAVWATMGLFNVAVVINSSARAASLQKWANSQLSAWECWQVSNQLICRVTVSPPDGAAAIADWRHDLAALAKERVADELTAALSEFISMSASAISRAENYLPSYIPTLRSNVDAIHRYVKERDESDFNEIYELQGKIININGALSRFSSQTFSGTSPIEHTECHFWVHSLLGTGSANLAIIQLVGFIDRCFAEARIPQRFGALAKRTVDLPEFLTDDEDRELVYGHYLDAVTLTPAQTQLPLVPPICYFSGRDGFKSHLHTVSAPLAVLSGCNTIQWTLLTLTHEISHIIVKGVLNHLLPDVRDREELDRAFSLAYGSRTPANWLEAIRADFLSTLCMELGETLRPGKNQSTGSEQMFRQSIEKYRGEAEEIMVHVFDFLYFYGQNEEKYTQSIWLSWSVIPNLSERIPEYVMRTLCALLVLHLRRENPEQHAVKSAQKLLKALKDSDGDNPHLQAAQDFLEKTKLEDLTLRLAARKPLVKLVLAFCYSEKIAARVRGESIVGGGHEGTGGYADKPGVLNRTPIGNPLNFVAHFTKGHSLSERVSFWLLYSIAYRFERHSSE